MNTFKTAVVLATLVGVGYGVHIVLNKPIPNGDQLGASTWGEIPDIRYDEMAPPEISEGLGAEAEDASASEDSAVAHPDGTYHADNGAARKHPVAPATANQPVGPPWPAPAELSPSPSAGASTGQPQPDTSVSPNAPTTAPGTVVPIPNTPAAPSNNMASSSSSSGMVAGPGGFEEVWQSAHGKLAAGQIADALFALTIWYNDPSLTISDRDRLIPLLDQLAGTVIYSREHHLAAPFSARGGETLENVAKQYNVPAEFLSRVNGIPTATSLSPGQSLKVVPGPFRAELDLGRRQLTLFLNHYYAGRFSVGVGRDLPAVIEQMEVVEKTGARLFRDPQTNHQIAAGAPDNPYGNHWIGLRDPNQPTNTLLGIHAWGANVDAADTRGCISVDGEDADDIKAILSLGSTIRVIR